jgi:hypothetical protein
MMQAVAGVTQPARSLAPREHGAYAQLGLPLCAALLGSRPTLAAVCFALGACAAFAAHEPLLVVLGQRGKRSLREAGGRAWRRLLAAAFASTALGALALVLAPSARAWAAAPVALAAAGLVFILRRSERTLAGELVAAAALTSAALPAAIAGGMPASEALAACGIFYATSLVSTVEVRAIARREAPSRSRIAAWSAAAGLVLLLAIRAPAFALAGVPTLLTVMAVAISRPSPSKLRRIGWALATASLLTAAGVVVAAYVS